MSQPISLSPSDLQFIHARNLELEKEVLELKEKIMANDNFLNMAAHEVKTPVTVLKAYAQMLLMQFRKDKQEKYSTIVEKMSDQLDKIIHMVADLLDTARFNSDSLYCLMNDMNLSHSLTNCFENIRAAHPDYTFICAEMPGEALISGDRDRLEQVIGNFISNAIKYSTNNKVITIESKIENRQVVVSVKDNGVGIPPDKQSRIFEQFYRVDDSSIRKLPGLGLGLFICSEIIKKHNGKIGVQSMEGEGSLFWFSIPLKTAKN